MNDVVTKINGQPVFQASTGGLAGKDIKVTITRDGQEMEVPMRVGSRQFTEFSLVEMPNASPQQIKVRDGWLKR